MGKSRQSDGFRKPPDNEEEENWDLILETLSSPSSLTRILLEHLPSFLFSTRRYLWPSLFKRDEIRLNNNWCLYELWTYYLQGAFSFPGIGCVYCSKFRTFFFSHYSHLLWAQAHLRGLPDFWWKSIPWGDPSSLQQELSKLKCLPCKSIHILLGKCKCSVKSIFRGLLRCHIRKSGFHIWINRTNINDWIRLSLSLF